jgi:uncharacterized protein (TIGR02270 family)
MGNDDAAVRDAVVRACNLAGDPRFERWLADRWRGSTTSSQRAALMGAWACRGLEPPSALVEWLQSDDVTLARAGAQAARRADPRRHLKVIEWLLEHPDDEVREASVVAAWTWGSPLAPAACERWALETAKPPRALPMALYAAMGGPAQHDRLAAMLARPTHCLAALSALGLSGNVRQIPRLLGYLEAKPPIVTKVAAQAIAMIVGVNLFDDAYTLAPQNGGARPTSAARPASNDEEEARALPPLADDDLESDLAPPPEDALPLPNPPAILRHCEEAAAKMDRGTRNLAGQRFRPPRILEYLTNAPLGRRHVLGLTLGIRTGGRAWLNTRASSARQRGQLDALMRADWGEVASAFGDW